MQKLFLFLTSALPISNPSISCICRDSLAHALTMDFRTVIWKSVFYYFFKFCKSVYHRTIQIDYQPDATIFQFIILMFIYSSTCFGRSPAHHHELNDCSSSLWFYLRIVVIAVLCSWSGRPAGPTTNTARLSPRYEGKTRGCHCSHWAPDDGRENDLNMLSCKQTSG